MSDDNYNFGLSQHNNHINTQNHAVIILASGLSQRLGQAKQLLPKNGKPLIHYMTNLAVASQAKTVIIVIPQYNAAIHSTANKLISQHLTLQIISNPSPQIGMAQSLSLAIDTLKVQQNLAIKRVLIMGVDQVLLDAKHLNQLLAKNNLVVASRYPNLDDNYALNDSKSDIIGLPIVIDYQLLKSWQSSLSGDKGLRHLIRALPAEQISSVDNSQLSYDIDTPWQLAYAQTQGWLDC